MLVRGLTIIIPLSKTVLSGIMAQEVISFLKQDGYQIEKQPLTLEDCLEADGLILTNSLMGAVPVLSLNGHTLPLADILCNLIN